MNAQADFTWKYEPRSLGSADRYGYAIWTVPLAKLTLDGKDIPLRAEFSTDPRPDPSPSPLGRGWAINFFSSALVEVDQDSMRWHRPDGRVFFFILERGNTAAQKRGPNDPITFSSKNDSWTAVKIPKKRIITLSDNDTGAEFVYEDGLLVRFAFRNVTKGAKRYSISYNRSRRPVRLTVFDSGKILAEFSYDNPERAKSLNLGETNSLAAKPIEFEYATAALNQFDAGPYLSKISDTLLTPLNITYQAENAEANRISLGRSAFGGTSSLVWKAKTGFIVEDEGASYKIENPSLANRGKPEVDPKTKSQVTDYNWRPDEAKVTRTDKEGKSEFRFYDRAKGVLTEKNTDGVTTVTSYLLTPGTMYGKVRKIEQLQGKDRKVIARNAYNDAGQMIRNINATGDISLWEYATEGENSVSRHYINNQPVSERFQSTNGDVITRNFTSDGIREFKRTQAGDNSVIQVSLNGILESEKTISPEGNLIKYLKADGTLMEWVKAGGEVRQIISQNGTHLRTLSATGKTIWTHSRSAK
ncbi:MAG: hypothetical protein H2169_08720 [Opitutus sp.]|nr:hypothetical protein [Opitutus sp.]MCS6299774.1 hypothetical protein [Opitutus sp.]